MNVGKGNKVPMAGLRSMLEGLGYSDISTLLNSGNAVFASTARDSHGHATRIADAIEDRFGVVTPVIVKSAADFDAIVAGNPIIPPASEHSRFLVAFAMDTAGIRDLNALQTLAGPGEKLVVTKNAAYLHCPGGLLGSKVGKALLGKAGRRVTTRNWATVLKLSSLLGESTGQPCPPAKVPAAAKKIPSRSAT